MFIFQGWPLWFVSASGYTAIQAIPEPLMNSATNFASSKLICKNTHRNSIMCSMKCKSLSKTLDVSSIITMKAQDFNMVVYNSLPYILQISVDNYLIYFSDWTADEYNFSCKNNMGIISTHMLCRYEVDDYPFIQSQCSSENITNRYIQPGQFISSSRFYKAILFRLC